MRWKEVERNGGRRKGGEGRRGVKREERRKKGKERGKDGGREEVRINFEMCLRP